MQVHDDRGVLVCLDRPPARIVSLVPSTTETLHALGAPVVGVTRFCARPADRVAALPKVGGTKDVDPERVRALAPDLIVGNCEENTREIFDALAGIAPVYAAFPRDVDGALADLDRLGDLVGRPVAALRARIE
ncbi:MAG TPA: helical backbone metal receptor, partial [Myxococcota bacterium]|nr:helical backbone metal receptor [Myxococcota bacterium]